MSFRYIGNKSRIATWIVEIVSRRVAGRITIADPMCGTASMSVAFAERGWRVAASDILKFPTLHAQARLFKLPILCFKDFGIPYAHAIAQLNELKPREGYFYNEFGAAGQPTGGFPARKYFSPDNAGKIDAIREQIAIWRLNGLSQNAVDLLLNDLILAANKVANISGTYGYFMKRFTKQSLEPLRVAQSNGGNFGISHVVQHGDAKDILSASDVDVVYLDPPYTKRQYGGNYHIPETLAVGDFPTPVGMGGLRDWRATSSDFCYRRAASSELRQTLQSVKSRWTFISYSNDGQIPQDEMLAICSEFGHVERVDCAIPRYRSNSRVAKDGAVTEFVFCVEMNRC